LKDGLIDAQLRTGTMLGTMSEEHRRACTRAAEQAIRQQLHDEIKVATTGVEVDLRVSADRIQTLEAQIAAIQGRLERLAKLRAEYANLVSATKYRSETLKLVEHDCRRRVPTRPRTHCQPDYAGRWPDAGARPLVQGKA